MVTANRNGPFRIDITAQIAECQKYRMRLRVHNPPNHEHQAMRIILIAALLMLAGCGHFQICNYDRFLVDPTCN